VWLDSNKEDFSMSEYEVGDWVCFKESGLPEFYGKTYCIFGRTAYGMLNDEVVILDGLSRRRVHESSIRLATPEEIKEGKRLP
jgi:hypothetical protein